MSGHSLSLNLGEVLRGDRIRQSDYELVMGKDVECRSLCTQTVDRRGVSRARKLIADGYVTEWIVDNLPGATRFVTVDKTRKYYAAGFKLGHTDLSHTTGQPRYFINNHVAIVIRWRKAPGRDGQTGRKVIVGFEVHPKSVRAGDRNEEGCPANLYGTKESMEVYLPFNQTTETFGYRASSYVPVEEDEDLDDDATLQIPYTYSVYYREENGIEWSNRWDLYFVNQETSWKYHWFTIINSLVISGLLTVVVAVIFARTIRSELKAFGSDGEEGKIKLIRKKPSSGRASPRSREKASGGLLEQLGDTEIDADMSSDDESLDEVSGWKLLHGDVFRTPNYGQFLAPLIGSGMQLVFMAIGLLVLSCLGVLNPSFRGGFISVGMGLFVFAGGFSGYFSGKLYQTFGGQHWRKNAFTVRCLILLLCSCN